MSRRYNSYYPPYVPVAVRQQRNAKILSRLAQDGRQLHPVVATGRNLAASFWGRAWCANVESYQDYANRLPRGRTYLRSRAVVDLCITSGRVEALVNGSQAQPYEILLEIAPLPRERWEALKQKCLGRIDSLLALVQGKLPPEILAEFCNPVSGLFPSPEEMRMTCSCPDWAGLCKHLAAVLYGIGIRLDEDPRLFFTLRGIQEDELLGAEAVGTLAEGTRPEIAVDNLSDMFGVEFDSLENAAPGQPPQRSGSASSDRRPAIAGTQKGSADAEAQFTPAVIGKLRQSLGFSQSELGEHCGCSATMVSLWERGRIAVAARYWERLSALLARQQEKEAAPQKGSAAAPPAGTTASEVLYSPGGVKSLRTALGLTQSGLGNLCGCSATMVSLWERGRIAVAARYWECLSELLARQQEKEAAANKSPAASPGKGSAAAPPAGTTASEVLYSPGGVKSLRTALGLTQSGLGNLCGCSGTLVSLWERGWSAIAPGYRECLAALLARQQKKEAAAKKRSAAAAPPAESVAPAVQYSPVEVKSLRTALGMTQSRLGELCGCSGAMVSLWERGSIAVSPRYRERLSELAESQQPGAVAAAGPQAVEEELGVLLSRYRQAHGLTRSELGRRLQVEGKVLRQWEQGKLPIPARKVRLIQKVISSKG
ncbi:MAG: helix-turn-helix domain-containing protein [Oligosphaeraceae bacterium]|nr:helix-turn-helix domain-containing protein [Oligosphaeraceae bacterium]